MLRKLTAIIVVALGLAHYSLAAHAEPVDDIRIVIDVSGSMVKTDPQNLRKPALRMISGVIPTGANAGVWTFGRYTNMEVKWGRVNHSWRRLAEQGADTIHSRGQFTNIEGALKRATSGWSRPDPDSSRNIILLTDGKVDIAKDKQKNAKSRRDILNKTIPLLEKNGVMVHTIALSNQTDEALLKQLAKRTGGSFEVADSAQQLQKVFLRMFERAVKPDTVPLQNNSFSVDNSISEMTILVFRGGDRETRLITPKGSANSQQKHASNINWKMDQGYDLITVKKPSAGQWKIDAELDPDNRVMIVTDLKLVVNSVPRYLMPNENLDFQVELHNKGKKIGKRSFLKFVDFSLTHKVLDERNQLPLELKKSRDIKDKGIYLQQIKAPLPEGDHEVVITADGSTFDRSKRYRIQVQWPLEVDLKPLGTPGQYDLMLTPRTESIDAQSAQLSSVLVLPDQTKRPITLEKGEGFWKAKLEAIHQDGPHQLFIDLHATSLKQESVEVKLGPYAVIGAKMVEQEKVVPEADDKVTGDGEKGLDKTAEDPDDSVEEESSLIFNIIVISVANVVLIAVGLGIYLFIRRKNQKEEFNLSDEYDDELRV